MSTRTTFERVLARIIESTPPDVDPSSVTEDTKRETLHMDSMDDIAFVIGLEDDFDLDISNEDCKGWQSVEEVCKYLDART